MEHSPKFIIVLTVIIFLVVTGIVIGIYFAVTTTSDDGSSETSPLETYFFIDNTDFPLVGLVDGSSTKSKVSVELDGNNTLVTTNTIPNYIPSLGGLDIAGSWSPTLALLGFNDGNPNGVIDNTITFSIPNNPVANDVFTDTNMGAMGIARNGVLLFNPYANPENEDAVKTKEVFGSCCSHSNASNSIAEGGMHYHKYPSCLRFLGSIQTEAEAGAQMIIDLNAETHSPLIGFIFDGFPIYGPIGYDSDGIFKLLQSSYTGPEDANGNPTFVDGSGDLDEANGLLSTTPDFGTIYHYITTVHVDSVTGYPDLGINYNYAYDFRTIMSLDMNDDEYRVHLQSSIESAAAAFTTYRYIPPTGELSLGDITSNYAKYLDGILADNPDKLSLFRMIMPEFPYITLKYKGTSTEN
jgi:hypothetical protein